MKRVLLYLMAASALLVPANSRAQCVYRVDHEATGNETGQNWDHAIPTLEAALLAAENCQDVNAEIWVAEGIYTPGTSRSATFQLANDVAIYGGFNATENQRSERNIELHETILSGDVAGDDGPDPFVRYADNVYHVVTGSGTDATAVLDGVTVRSGNATESDFTCTEGAVTLDGLGGGLLVHGTSATVISGTPTIRNCKFELNQACVGGGAIVVRGGATFEHCTFVNNDAVIWGGGLYNTGGASNIAFGGIQVEGCRFVTNTAARFGGGTCSSNSAPLYVNCEFVDNAITTIGEPTDPHFGGGMSIGCDPGSNNCGTGPRVVNCSFSHNRAQVGNGFGGGIGIEDGTSTQIRNCVFWENIDSGGVDEESQIYFKPGASAEVSYSYIHWMDANGTGFDDPANHNTGNNGVDPDPDFMQDTYRQTVVVGNLRTFQGSATHDAADNDEIPSGIDYDRDDALRILDDDTVTDTGNGTGDIVDMGAYEYSDHPYILVNGAAGTSFDEQAFSNYIDPRAESTDGVNIDLGIQEITIAFSEKVVTRADVALKPSGFIILESAMNYAENPESPPTVVCVCVPSGAPTTPYLATLTLDRIITPQAWTTIIADVEDVDANLIVGADRLHIGFLPGNTNQDTLVGPNDLLKIRQYIEGTADPESDEVGGVVADYVDINRDGTASPFDLLVFRQLLLGQGNATRNWTGAAMNVVWPLCCR